MKTKDLTEVGYYQGIYNNFLLLGNGDVVFGYNLHLPEIWTLDPDGFANLNSSLLQLIHRIPDQTTLHFQSSVFENTHQVNLESGRNRLELEDLKHWDQRRVVRFYLRLFVTFSHEKINRISELDNPMLRYQAYALRRPFKNADVQTATWDQEVKSIETLLEGIARLQASRMEGEELLESVQDHLSQTYDRETKSRESILPDISFDQGQVLVGHENVAVVSLRKEGESLYDCRETHTGNSAHSPVELPKHVKLPSSMSFPLTIGLPFSHIYNVAIEKVNQDVAFDEMRKLKRKNRLLQLVGNGKAIRQRDEIGGLKDSQGEILSNGLIDQVEKNGHIITRCMVNVILKDASRDHLSEKIESAINAFHQMNGSIVQVENGHGLNLFFASGPGCMRFNYRALWHFAEQSIQYVPKEGLYRTDKEGIRFMDRTGCPITVNTWSNRHIVNRNALVFAPSGSGKSVLLNHMINQYVAMEYSVIIIDIGGSFQRNTIINGGHYFDAADPKNLQFNIFLSDQQDQSAHDNSQKEQVPSSDHINFVLSILLKIWKGESRVEKETKAALKKAIEAYYEKIHRLQELPSMKGFYEFLQEYQEQVGEKVLRYLDVQGFLLVLEEYATGKRRDLLNGRNNIRLNHERLLVFDLEAIKNNPDVNEIVIAIVMYYASEIIDHYPGRKAYIVDEAIDYLKGDMGEFISALFRKIRKRNGQVILSTQGIGYLEELDELTKKSIFGNTSTVWLLSHQEDKGSYPLLREHLSMTEGELQILDSVGRGPGYREVFLKMGSTYNSVLRVEISPFSLLAYTTDPEEVSQLEHHYQKSKNHITAIRDYLEST